MTPSMVANLCWLQGSVAHHPTNQNYRRRSAQLVRDDEFHASCVSHPNTQKVGSSSDNQTSRTSWSPDAQYNPTADRRHGPVRKNKKTRTCAELHEHLGHPIVVEVVQHVHQVGAAYRWPKIWPIQRALRCEGGLFDKGHGLRTPPLPCTIAAAPAAPLPTAPCFARASNPAGYIRWNNTSVWSRASNRPPTLSTRAMFAPTHSMATILFQRT